MDKSLQTARKEFAAFFASPVAWLFLGAFLAVSLFVFFWVETFFARNLGDVRPLFEWMPVLLVFLVAALTMRAWSEERRAGTLEMLLTLPVTPLQLVFGKFLAGLGLVALALALTLPLPLTVSLLAPLDWGPVLGGYLAALALAAAYIAIGLYVSARTDNQIVSLIGTVLVCGVFFFLGSDALTSLFGNRGGEFLKLLGTGSRFDAITRGVIDLRDLYYYLSLVGVFLALNVYSLERLRWAPANAQADAQAGEPAHRRQRWAVGLLAANFLAANLWLHPVGWLRADITEGNIYSISEATRDYLAQAREPLLIRGYFSAQTHPLLAPLVPQMRDLLREYEVAGRGRVRVEFLDPLERPELEQEAGEKFGIRPVAFQTASKYQAAVVNSYFDVVVQYGDQFETLGFRDLIEVKARSEDDLEVRLRNPEYDITRAIKKTLYAYKGGGDLFGDLPKPVTFHGYLSGLEHLPEPLPELRRQLEEVLRGLQQRAGDKFRVVIEDPAAGDGRLAQEIAEKYGFQPLALGLLDPTSFYFYMLLESDGQEVVVALPESLDQEGLQRAIEAGIKRLGTGMLRTLALYTPPPTPSLSPFGNPGDGGPRFSYLEDALGTDAALKRTDLASGQVPNEADLLLVVDPKGFDDKQVFALDQYLMQGGTVVIAASPYDVNLGGGSVGAQPQATGLEAWLGHHGIDLEPALVLDPQNTPFPIPVTRRIGGFAVQEIQSLAYPFFPDIREDGLAGEGGIASGLGQVTLTWASPIALDDAKHQGRKVTRLLHSSPRSWSSPGTDIQPDFQRYPETGFPAGQDAGSKLLGVMVEGRFESFFKGRPSPLLQQDEPEPVAPETELPAEQVEKRTVVSGVVENSPASARIILLSSATFLGDTALDLAAQATQTRYLKPVQLVENLVDWSLEDHGLLALRGRSHFSRLLAPLSREQQIFWEYLNYGLAALGLLLVWGLRRQAANRRRDYYAQVMGEAAGATTAEAKA
jgi:ABC-2 type transport system permease protein